MSRICIPLTIANEFDREGALSELLYAEDLVVMKETIE